MKSAATIATFYAVLLHEFFLLTYHECFSFSNPTLLNNNARSVMFNCKNITSVCGDILEIDYHIIVLIRKMIRLPHKPGFFMYFGE